MQMERLKKIKRVILSVGHGGSKSQFDTGAVANGTTENEQCRIILGYLVKELLSRNIVLLVIPDWSLQATISYINNVGVSYSDWAIELHKDSALPYNAEAMHRRFGIYYHPESAGSGPVAKAITDLMKKSGASDTSWSRADTESPRKKLAWIRQPKMLSHIVELGFIEGNNSDDENRWWAASLAEAISSLVLI
jgi:N-acetylmuramoyl-L-alanine amidase